MAADKPRHTGGGISLEQKIAIARRIRTWLTLLTVGVVSVVLPATVASELLAVIAIAWVTTDGVQRVRSWRRFDREAVAVGVVATTLAALVGEASWWQPALVYITVAGIPGLAGLSYDAWLFFGPDQDSLTGDGRWLIWSVSAPVLRAIVAIGAWVGTYASAGLGEAAKVTAPLLAVAVGRPIIASLSLFLILPFTGTSTSWRISAGLVAGLLLARLPVRPPRRKVGLPSFPVLFRHPLGLFRLRRIDRFLATSRWEQAVEHLGSARVPAQLEELVDLRLARAHIERGWPQQALDALRRPLLSDQDDRRAAARRLAGDAQVQMGQSQQALDSLLLARSLSSDVVHQALIALSASVALNEIGKYSDSAYQAGWAASRLSGRGFLIERLQASRLLVDSRRRSGDLEGAVRAVKGAVGVGLSSRWIRQYVRFGARSRNDASALFLRGGPALLEIIRLNVLEAELQLDPRTDGTTAAAKEDLDECIDSFHLLGSSLDAANAELVLARVLAAEDKSKQALKRVFEALTELDRVRHSLRTQVARARWFSRFNDALGIALDLGHKCNQGTQVAELIELARLQAFPVLRADELGSELSLAAAPTIRVRGQAHILRRQAHHTATPVDLEDAAASAAGPDAWWLAYWSARPWIYWALVPPTGEIDHGRISIADGEELPQALDKLRSSLPIVSADESRADLDIRMSSSPMLISPEQEQRLFLELGRLLLPPRLASELRKRSVTQPLAIAISPTPELASVPWSLLALEGESLDCSPLRLVERATWSLAGSATLQARAAGLAAPAQPYPLRLAVLDPRNEPPEFPGLPAARDVAAYLPSDVGVLGGPHWCKNVATWTSVMHALRSTGGSSTAMFGCHAVRAEPGQSATSALVLAPGSDDEGRLTAQDLIGAADPAGEFPAQISLQACDTSDVAASESGEWMTLAPAFLVAGARTVVTTLFPLIDCGNGVDDPIHRAMVDGTDLAHAVRTTQLDGLRRWRDSTSPRVEETPLVWGAYAICTAGRARATACAPPAPAVSRRLHNTLASAAGTARDIRDKTVTSGHFCAAYVGWTTEVVDDSMVRGLLLYALAKLTWSSASKSATWSSPRPSRELVEFVELAIAQADREGAVVQPEHVILEILKRRKGPGWTVLRWGGINRLRAFHGSVTSDLLRGAAGTAPSSRSELRCEALRFADGFNDVRARRC